jgi:MarR family transcriptional regulator, organic hydroperoxide resistance regulator
LQDCDLVVDANGVTARPGFIDSHVHIAFGDYTPRMRAAVRGSISPMPGRKMESRIGAAFALYPTAPSTTAARWPDLLCKLAFLI